MRAPEFLRRLFGRKERTGILPTTSGTMGTSVWAGGQVSRLTSDWVTVPISADRELVYDMTRLRARARDLVRNSGFGTRFLGLLCDNVLGHKGIRLDVDITLAQHDTVGDTVEAAWMQWGHPESCDVAGQLSWADLERLAVRSLAQDGEILWRLIRGAGNDFGFGVQVLDPDLLDVNYNRVATASANEIRMGVEKDAFGKPVAYWLWTFHPNDYGFAVRSGERVRVPADEIIHEFLHLRPGQTRGVSWFAPVLYDAQMLKGYAEAEVTAARVAAAKMGFIAPPADAATAILPGDGSPGQGGMPNQAGLEMDASPGEFGYLPPGYTMQSWDPQHPGKEYSAFTKALMREIANGLGIPYNDLANDLEAVNYSSMRAGALAARDTWRVLQVWLAEHLHRRVFEAWLPMAILAGALPGKARAALTAGATEWLGRGWAWVDPLKDLQAVELGIAIGVESRKATLAEEGREVEDVFGELADEQAMAEKLGITVESAQTPKQLQTDLAAADTGEPTDSEPQDGAKPTNGNGNGNGKSKQGPRAAVLAALKGAGGGR